MSLRLNAERARWGHYFYPDTQGARALRVGFGKHRGVLATDVRRDYWAWCVGNMTDLHPGAANVMRQLAAGHAPDMEGTSDDRT